MYKKIEILETDFKDKYLIIYKGNSMYVSFVAKEIIELLKIDKSNYEICLSLSSKYNAEINTIIVEEVENNIKKFLNKDESQSFIKLFKILNPSKINIPKSFLFDFVPFYSILLISATLNILIYFNCTIEVITSNNEKIGLYIMLFFVLLFHELGHSISARKFNVKVTEIGLGFYYILPVLYVNLNEIWKLEPKKRIVINFSGIYFQLLIGMLLFLLSLVFYDYKNILINLFNLNFIIVLLNFNPFIKFDGYWIISDLLNERNLEKTSNNMIKNLFKIKKPNVKYPVLIYAILRFVFIVWLLNQLLNYFYNNVEQIFTSKTINISNSFSIIILLFFLYKIVNTFNSKKH